MIYLDEAATTEPTPEAIAAFEYVAQFDWMNPSSKLYSVDAANILSSSRQLIANVLRTLPDNIIFTSGATEAANWIISQKWDAIITDRVEHPCVYNAVQASGAFVEYVSVDKNGAVDLSSLYRCLEFVQRAKYERVLVAIMGANNELGTIEPIDGIAQIVRRYPNVRFFADMTQAWAHGAIYLPDVDYACASAHKFGAFKGSGFAYIKEPDQMTPLIWGGAQEAGLRAGTENVGGIYAMAKMFSSASKTWCKRNYDARSIRYHIKQLAKAEGYRINGGSEVLPNIVSITLPDCRGDKMASLLAMDNIYISTGSACSSGDSKPSRVLMATGMTEDEARRTIRISFGSQITLADIDTVFEKIKLYREVLRE